MSTTSLRQAQIEEIVKCGKEPSYFMKKYVRIQHPVKGIIPFTTYKFQDDCVSSFKDHRLNIVLKARQLGLSTVAAAYAVWYAVFYRDKNILVIATKLSTAINFIKKVRIMIDNLPKWLLLPGIEPSKQSIRFTNGSSITAIPTSDDAGRSEALSLLIIDEAAFIKNFEDIWTGLYPTISTGGRAIILSTPNGVGGTYYRLWTEAEAGVNEFNPIRLSWEVHPEHGEEWFKSQTRNLPKRKIAQEYLTDFISSGDTFLQPDALEAIRTSIKTPIVKEGPNNGVWIWSQPIDGHQYVISADVSRGDARDFSAFHVIDVLENAVAAEYMGKVPPEVLGELMVEYGKRYNVALLCPENNTFGYFTCKEIKKLGYRRLYYHGHKGDPFNYVPLDDTENGGFPTSPVTRVQILSKLEELIRTKSLKIYSQRLYDQLQSFIWNGNKPMASKDSYDDLVMSLAIGGWLIDGSSGVTEQAAAMAMAILASTKIERRNRSEMQEINSIQPLVNSQIRGLNPYNVHKPRDPSNVRHVDITDFSWLLR